MNNFVSVHASIPSQFLKDSFILLLWIMSNKFWWSGNYEFHHFAMSFCFLFLIIKEENIFLKKTFFKEENINY